MNRSKNTLRLFSVCLLAGVLAFSGFAYAGFQTDYDAALATFRSAKVQADYQRAATLFTALATRNDVGTLKANTLFWLAECFYGMKDYTRALNTFERVMTIPKSNKEEDSRYKVAVCYIRLNLHDAARWELTRFLRDFPSSSKVDLVRKELNKLPAESKGN